MYRNYQNLPYIHWNAQTVLVSVLALFIYTGNFLIAGTIWFILLKDYGAKIEWKETLRIISVSQFGKYLPGNIGQHVGRVVLANEKEVPIITTLQTLFIESAILAIAGISISVLGFFFYSFQSFHDSRIVIIQLIVLALVALFLPKFFFFIVNRYAKGRLLKFTGGVQLRIPKLFALIQVSVLYIITFFNIGIVLDLIAKNIFEYPDSNIFLLTTAFAWSWILGYLTPGAPAGLGIREAIIVASLSSQYEPGIAIGLSVILRFITTIGDGAVFLIASYYKKIHQTLK
ncbi:lysylphosphatidylglycerol synthase domain-containing protein [Leptospira haakeii]|uniref:lysylphosphatidylglycerol synthase domain-containing protein n=1 Tax=Leptospira haakeii TaxID=2023198 RepID=UPI0013FD6367